MGASILTRDLDSALFALAKELGGALVGIDTSGPVAALCVVNPVADQIYATQLDSSVARSERLFDSLAEQLAIPGARPSELASVVVTVGPGSFTGLRVGLATVKGLCMGAEIPVVGVSSLAVLAASVANGGLVVPAVDARRSQVFGGVYERQAPPRQQPSVLPRLSDGVFNPEELAAHAMEIAAGRAITWIGDYAARMASIMPVDGRGSVSEAPPDMRAGILLATSRLRARNFDSTQSLVPQYLRLSEPERKLLERERVHPEPEVEEKGGMGHSNQA